MRKRTFAALLALCVLLLLLPAAALAAGTGAIQWNASGIKPGNRVYLGKYGEYDVTWLALKEDPLADDWFNDVLLSEYLLGGNVFDNEQVYYKGSALNAKMDDLYNGANALFTPEERVAIAEQTDLSCVDGPAGGSEPEDDPASPSVPTAHLYPLSYNEAAAQVWGSAVLQAKYITAQSDLASDWWLRSTVESGFVPRGVMGANHGDQNVGKAGHFDPVISQGVRPAFRLSASDIAFSSPAVNGKRDDGVSSTLAEVSATVPTEWKLTLKDDRRSGFCIISQSIFGNELTVEYYNAATGPNEYISAIIENGDVHDGQNITHYGRILHPQSANGTVTINLPEDMEDTDRLYIFSEQRNGDKKTDYASHLCRVDTDPITYAIEANPAALSFGRAYVGGMWPAAQTVRVANTGNRDVTIYKPELSGYTVTAGEGFSGDNATIPVGGSATFTVRPDASLGVGTHNGKLNIAGDELVYPLEVPVGFVVGEPYAAMQLGTGGVGNPYGGVTPSAYSRVYFGVDGANPIAWRVLDAAKTNTGESGMFLLSEGFVPAAAQAFDESGEVYYNISGIRKILQTNDNSILNTDFSDLEREAMLATTKTDGGYEIAGRLFHSAVNILNADKLFLLSVLEVDSRDYFPISGRNYVASNSGDSQQWWLRSTANDDRYGVPIVKGYIDQNGNLSVDNPKASHFVRPAFNLDTASVLFTSAEGGKSASGTDGGLAAMGVNVSDFWKLTLKDSGRQGFGASPSALSGTAGESVSVSYSGAKSGMNERLSAMVVNDAGKVLYYGRLKSITAATDESGTQSIAIPAELAGGTYTLRLFNEQYNGEQKTDYASPFADVTLTVSAPAPTVTSVTVAPSEPTVLKGTPQTFTATVTGENNPAQTVTWNVTGANSTATAISATGVLTVGGDETATSLTVTATSAVDPTKSGTASVTIPNIVITAHPADQHVLVGERATFTIAATGDGLRYQWRVNRNDGLGWQDLPGETGASYTTAPTKRSNNGFLYACHLMEAHGYELDSGSATLRVTVHPPQTGDGATPVLWLCLCLLGGAGALALARGKRRGA